MFHIKTLEMAHWDFWQRFSVPLDAQIVTIIGPNGSGKTTLLDALRTLLALKCSGKRDYKRYVRNAREPFAWLRGVVDNPRKAGGLFPYPFWPMTEERVTLGCRIRKQGGDWVRHYTIQAGDVSIEDLDARGEWLGVNEYRRRLEQAGLTPAIAEVLALEQGDTDKLCEYSPRALLDLVFQVFGDKQVMDNYQQARTEQREAERELETLRQHLTEAEMRHSVMVDRANRYQEWRRLQNKIERLQGEILPQVRVLDAQRALGGLIRDLRGRQRGLWQKQGELETLDQAVQAGQLEIEALGTQERAAHAARQQEQEQFQAARDRVRDLEAVLRQREQLQALAAEKHGEASVQMADQLTRDRARLQDLNGQLKQYKQQREELTALAFALRSGQTHAPERDVAALRSALDEAGIGHRLLTDLVEVSDNYWQGAVEAILRPYRSLVVLQREQDRHQAWAIGEQLRYRHFIAGDSESPPKAEPGSLLEVVRFSAPAPGWLYQLLGRVQRVENAEAARGRSGDWITRDGYYRERRGARHIGVAAHEFAFGEGARTRRLQEAEQALQSLQQTILQLEQEGGQLAQAVSQLQARLMGLDAVQMLSARAEEFRLAEESLPEAQGLLADIGGRLAEADSAYQALLQQRHQLELAQRDRVVVRNRCQDEVQRTLLIVQTERLALGRRIEEVRTLKRALPAEWTTSEALSSLRQQYESEPAVLRALQDTREQLDTAEWETDDSVLVLRDKLRDDVEHQRQQVGLREGHYQRALQLTDDARAAYLNVLRATVKRYGRNVTRLGELAGIEVHAELPHLSNDDVALAQTGLEVRFNFDQKGLMGLNDGEASGGQQVMKSLILLISLMMDDDRPGGFVFIDEPFAHLDIFNIDRVSSFLQATQAQYLITTPNTHNVNVFTPSELTLVTRKKQPGDGWAQPIGVVRRYRQ